MRATYCLLIICLLLLTLTIALAVPLLWGDNSPRAEGISFVQADSATGGPSKPGAVHRVYASPLQGL